jgi:hypothetical protein
VDEVYLGENGIRYDRIFCIINVDTRKAVHTANLPEVTSLTGRIEGDTLVITTKHQTRVKHLAKEVRIPMNTF